MHIAIIAILVACFAIGTFTTLNIGALALVASLAIGTLLIGESVSDVLAGFPVELFLLIFGVTYLFGLAASNGTMDYLLHRLAGRLGGRRHLLAPMLFVVTLVAVSIGAALPAVSAVIGGLALRLSRTLQVPVLLSSLMVMFGGIGGTFSPITLGGLIVHSTLARGGLAVSPVALYMITLMFSVVFAGVALVMYYPRSQRTRTPVSASSEKGVRGFGARSAQPARTGVLIDNDGPDALVGADRPDVLVGTDRPDELAQDDRELPTLTAPRLATILGIAALAVGLLVFRLDVGALAAAIAVALHLAFPRVNGEALKGVNWGVLLMLCGIVTYIELLQRVGTIDAFGHTMESLGSPLLAVFLICLVIAAFSALASSAALLVAGILLITPFLDSGSLAPLGVVAALAISATAVDVSPVSSASALLLAGAPAELQQHLYRGLLRWSLTMIVVAPVAAIGVLVVPGFW